jgi:hypothetical protein
MIMKERLQTLHTDVMHIDSHKFLVSLVEPLQLTIQTLLKNEMADQLGVGLQGQLSLIQASGFQPTVVYVDPQTGFRAIKDMFPGVLIDDSGAADHVPKIDVRIRWLKEIYRAVKNGLPWNLPINLVKYLVAYAVGHMNIWRTSSLSTNMSPYHLFMGTKINYKKSLVLAFGDYCEVFDESDNTSKSHSLPCIALHLCNNSTGSWQFLNIMTGVMIRRSNWQWMVTTQAVIDKINSMLTLAPKDKAAVPGAQETSIAPAPNMQGITEPQETSIERQDITEPILTKNGEEIDTHQLSNEENTAPGSAQEAIVPVQRSA